jgi:molecular chaperone DnaJ
MDPYKILGVPRDANDDQIRKAYLTLAKTKHPDKGGTAAEFQAIERAKSILTDPAKRAHYDRTGEDPDSAGVGDDNGGGSGGHGFPGGFPFPADIFAHMMGGGNGGGFPGFMFNMSSGGGGARNSDRRNRGKPPAKMSRINIPLHDMFIGKSLNINASVPIFCEKCDAKGFLKTETCGQCRGTGHFS